MVSSFAEASGWGEEALLKVLQRRQNKPPKVKNPENKGHKLTDSETLASELGAETVFGRLVCLLVLRCGSDAFRLEWALQFIYP